MIKPNITSHLLLILSALTTTPCVASEIETSTTEEQDFIKLSQSIGLKSDHSRLDGKTGIFEHCGNATLTQPNLTLSADCLTGKRNQNGKYEFIIAKGKPAVLTQNNPIKQESLLVKAGIIEYKVPVQQFLIIENASLKLTGANKDSFEIAANKIQLDNRIETNRDIVASGSPVEIQLIKAGETELKAKSKKLHFNTGTSKLNLSKNVTATLGLGQITAGNFRYNTETKVSSFEKSEGDQVEIIQTKKQQ